jgi:site-specific recombinase XerD
MAATRKAKLAKGGILDAFAAFLPLNVAQEDASPQTVRSYHAQVGQFVAWSDEEGIEPPLASEEDLEACRRHLVEAHYTRGMIGVKLSAVRRLYQAAVWWGLRPDNPAEGLKPPREATERAERIKLLPLESLKRLLAAPGQSRKARRDRAILALMGYHGLRVAEVAGLTVDDYRAGSPAWVTVYGKGSKTRQVYLT